MAQTSEFFVSFVKVFFREKFNLSPLTYGMSLCQYKISLILFLH